MSAISKARALLAGKGGGCPQAIIAELLEHIDSCALTREPNIGGYQPERGAWDSMVPPQQRDSTGYVTVPVLAGFEKDAEIIGEIRVQASKLPRDPDFVFALGYLGDFSSICRPGFIPASQPQGPFQLLHLALVSDTDYAAFLRQVGA